MEKQLADVRHDYIRYANCWEDADLLLKGLDPSPGDRILSIASAGDNSFALLLGDPDLVVAVDINPVQLELVRLKKAAFQALNYQQCLEFLGFRSSEQINKHWELVKVKLSPDSQEFWQGRMEEIKRGVIHQGKFERYFHTFRRKVLPFIHRKSTIDALFAPKSASDQAEFCNKRWFNRRWIFLFKIFFSRKVMGALGRDPKFLNEVKIRVSSFILNQARLHLSTVYCQKNYFLHYILKGDFGEDLPPYMRKENYELIRRRLDRLEIFEGLAEAAFAQYASFNKFNLSNIFEYMDEELFTKVAASFDSHSTRPARFAYWNLMVPRKMHDLSLNLHSGEKLVGERAEDKGFFYLDFNLSLGDEG